jgi:hypothetical protein
MRAVAVAPRTMLTMVEHLATVAVDKESQRLLQVLKTHSLV